MFTNYLTADLFKYRKQVFLYVNDTIRTEDLKNSYFEDLPEEGIDYIIDILEYKDERWDGTGLPNGKKGE